VHLLRAGTRAGALHAAYRPAVAVLALIVDNGPLGKAHRGQRCLRAKAKGLFFLGASILGKPDFYRMPIDEHGQRVAVCDRNHATFELRGLARDGSERDKHQQVAQ
jgi:hypothetical protein